jgi:hypothetical protein
VSPARTSNADRSEAPDRETGPRRDPSDEPRRHFGPTDADDAGRLDAEKISPRPIAPERRPVLQWVIPIVALTGALAALLYVLARG